MQNQHGELGGISEAVRKRDLVDEPGIEILLHIEQRLRTEKPRGNADDADTERAELADRKSVV